MMRDWYDQTAMIDLHMREMRAAAERGRLIRQARGRNPLRRRVGRFLISAGEALTR